MSLAAGCATPLKELNWFRDDEPRAEKTVAAKKNDAPPAKKSPPGFGADDVALVSDIQDAGAAGDEKQIKTEDIKIAPADDQFGVRPVSVDQVFNYARLNHPTLKAKAQEIDLARAERIGAGLFANPQLVMDADGPVDGDNQPSLSTRIDFTLPIGHKRQRGMSAAAAAEERARMELAYETDLVLLEVSDALADVLYLQELATQQQEISDINARFSALQQDRAKQNVITDVDRLLAVTAAKEAEFDRLRTLSDLEQARLLLAQAMGMTNPRPLVLTDRLVTAPVPEVPLERIYAAAREIRPEFRAGNWGIREQQRRADLARAAAIPDLTLSPRYSETFNDGDDQMGARLASDLLLWNWNQGEIAEALAGTRQAEANLKLYESTTFGDMAQAYVRLAPLQRQLDYYDQQVEPAMGEAIASIEKAFDVQAIDAAELSQQLTRLAKLRRDHLELKYLHHQMRMRIEILLRRPISSLATEAIPAGRPLGAPLPLGASPRP